MGLRSRAVVFAHTHSILARSNWIGVLSLNGYVVAGDSQHCAGRDALLATTHGQEQRHLRMRRVGVLRIPADHATTTIAYCDVARRRVTRHLGNAGPKADPLVELVLHVIHGIGPVPGPGVCRRRGSGLGLQNDPVDCHDCGR